MSFCSIQLLPKISFVKNTKVVCPSHTTKCGELQQDSCIDIRNIFSFDRRKFSRISNSSIFRVGIQLVFHIYTRNLRAILNPFLIFDSHWLFNISTGPSEKPQIFLPQSYWRFFNIAGQNLEETVDLLTL